ncbi:unnamed protein product [Rotaria socialis]|uniref:Uncharacterized protein n=1 Tax=Rotaria socialis TaxID=392032 RepID=A0A821TNA8_9BILA|nr:unnamed protein product [Rotaria socialis]
MNRKVDYLFFNLILAAFENSARVLRTASRSRDQHRQIQVKVSIFDVSNSEHALFIGDVSSLNQCSNYTLDTDASRLATYSATTTGCDSTVFATPLSYCSKIDMI